MIIFYFPFEYVSHNQYYFDLKIGDSNFSFYGFVEVYDTSASMRVCLRLSLVEVDLAEMLPDAGEEVSARAGGEQRELAGARHRVGP